MELFEKELVTRKTIPELYAIKMRVVDLYRSAVSFERQANDLIGEIHGYGFFDVKFTRRELCGENREIQAIDRDCWEYLTKLFHLERYMLCTEYNNLQKQIYDYQFPEFTPENAASWLANLKNMIHENVQKLIESVYDNITRGTYYTGSGYSSLEKKKRNNNGIDKFFILYTCDLNRINRYDRSPTITDDLEKACYLIDGKDLPVITIKQLMKKNKIFESQNPYFRIRMCVNGNTHYWINEEIRNKLNLYGSRRGVIGENIHIKIFDKGEL